MSALGITQSGWEISFLTTRSAKAKPGGGYARFNAHTTFLLCTPREVYFCHRAWPSQIYSADEKEVRAWTLEVLKPYQAFFREVVFGSFRFAHSFPPAV